MTMVTGSITALRSSFATNGRSETYLEAIEDVLGLPLRPEEAGRIDMTEEHCLILRARLRRFYEIYPLSSAHLGDDPGISPIYTSDVSHLRNMRSSTSGIVSRLNGQASARSGQLANLFLYARSTIMADDLAMTLELIGAGEPGAMTDAECVQEVNKCLYALCFIADLVRSDTIVFYQPSGIWGEAYEQLQEDLVLGTSLSPVEVFGDWVRDEVLPNPSLLPHLDTWAVMAMTGMSTSLVFNALLGRNSAPVLSGPKAFKAYERLVQAAAPNLDVPLPQVRDAANLYSYSSINLSQLPLQAFADLRYDSRSFAMWQRFLDESLEETRDYENKDRPFDDTLRGSLLRRGRDFEARLQQEFGDTSIGSAFQFNSTNAIGFVAGVSGSLVTGTPAITALLTGVSALTVERIFAALRASERRAVASIVRRHYHAMLPTKDLAT